MLVMPSNQVGCPLVKAAGLTQVLTGVRPRHSVNVPQQTYLTCQLFGKLWTLQHMLEQRQFCCLA